MRSSRTSPANLCSFALVVKWYNNGFVIRNLQFDSVLGHQIQVTITYKVVVDKSSKSCYNYCIEKNMGVCAKRRKQRSVKP